MTCNLETSQFPESNIQLLLPFAHAAQGVRVVIKFLKQKWNLYGQGIFLWYADNTLIIFWAVDILLKFLSIRILMILFFSRLSSKIFLDMQFRNWWYFGQGMILPFAGIGVERNGKVAAQWSSLFYPESILSKPDLKFRPQRGWLLSHTP